MSQQQRTLSSRFAQFVLEKPLNACVLSVIFAVLPLFSWLSAVIVCLVTLRRGGLEGIKVLLWAILPDIAMLFGDIPRQLIVMDLLVGFSLPFLFAVTLRRTASWSAVMLVAVLSAVVGLFVLASLFPTMPALLVEQLSQTFLQLHNAGRILRTPEQLQPFINAIGPFVYGGQLVVILVSTLVTLLIARSMQANLFMPGALKPELMRYRAHRGYSLLVIVSALAVFNEVYLSSSLLLLSLLPIVMSAGILVRDLVSQRSKKGLLLFFFYVSVVVFMPFSLLPVLLLGVGDSWFNLRHHGALPPSFEKVND